MIALFITVSMSMIQLCFLIAITTRRTSVLLYFNGSLSFHSEPALTSYTLQTDDIIVMSLLATLFTYFYALYWWMWITYEHISASWYRLFLDFQSIIGSPIIGPLQCSPFQFAKRTYAAQLVDEALLSVYIDFVVPGEGCSMSTRWVLLLRLCLSFMPCWRPLLLAQSGPLILLNNPLKRIC